MSKTHSEQKTITEFKGRKLPTPIEYSVEWTTYADKSEAVEDGKWPADVDTFILSRVNASAKNSAASAAYQEQTKALQKEYEQTDEYKRSQVVASIMATGKTQAEAEAIADSIGV